jgi:hypothetical protein
VIVRRTLSEASCLNVKFSIVHIYSKAGGEYGMAKKVMIGVGQNCFWISLLTMFGARSVTRKHQGGAKRLASLIAAKGGPTSGSLIENRRAMAVLSLWAVSAPSGWYPASHSYTSSFGPGRSFQRFSRLWSILVMTDSASHPWMGEGIHDGVDRGSVSVERGCVGALLYSNCRGSDHGTAGSMLSEVSSGGAMLLVASWVGWAGLALVVGGFIRWFLRIRAELVFASLIAASFWL